MQEQKPEAKAVGLKEQSPAGWSSAAPNGLRSLSAGVQPRAFFLLSKLSQKLVHPAQSLPLPLGELFLLLTVLFGHRFSP